MVSAIHLNAISIRYATAEDTEAIVALGERLMQESRFKHYRYDPEKIRSLIQSALATQPHTTCILLAHTKQNNQLIGILAGQLMGFFFCDGLLVQDRLYYITPEYRGSQAAFKLMIALRRWAEERNALEMNINMSTAIDMKLFDKFMLHLGFSSCGSNFTLPLRIMEG